MENNTSTDDRRVDIRAGGDSTCDSKGDVTQTEVTTNEPRRRIMHETYTGRGRYEQLTVAVALPRRRAA